MIQCAHATSDWVAQASPALASTWPEPRQVTVVEADPDGGVLAARRTLAPEPGLVTLAAALRRGTAALSPHTQSIGVDATAVVAPVSAGGGGATPGTTGTPNAYAERTSVAWICGNPASASLNSSESSV